jgi:hypothetical protein
MGGQRVTSRQSLNRKAQTKRALATASRLVAKVDSAAVQDGFQLYPHGFIVTDDSHWAVVQQGMDKRGDAGKRTMIRDVSNSVRIS